MPSDAEWYGQVQRQQEMYRLIGLCGPASEPDPDLSDFPTKAEMRIEAGAAV
jgi:hypothetical protein